MVTFTNPGSNKNQILTNTVKENYKSIKKRPSLSPSPAMPTTHLGGFKKFNFMKHLSQDSSRVFYSFKTMNIAQSRSTHLDHV